MINESLPYNLKLALKNFDVFEFDELENIKNIGLFFSEVDSFFQKSQSIALKVNQIDFLLMPKYVESGNKHIMEAKYTILSNGVLNCNHMLDHLIKQSEILFSLNRLVFKQASVLSYVLKEFSVFSDKKNNQNIFDFLIDPSIKDKISKLMEIDLLNKELNSNISKSKVSKV